MEQLTNHSSLVFSFTVNDLEFDFYSVNVKLKISFMKIINPVKIVYGFDFLMLTVNIVPVSIGKMENVCGLWLLLPQWKK